MKKQSFSSWQMKSITLYKHKITIHNDNGSYLVDLTHLSLNYGGVCKKSAKILKTAERRHPAKLWMKRVKKGLNWRTCRLNACHVQDNYLHSFWVTWDYHLDVIIWYWNLRERVSQGAELRTFSGYLMILELEET